MGLATTVTSPVQFGVPDEVLCCLSSRSQEVVKQIYEHVPEPFDVTAYPSSRFAAVLLLLFEHPSSPGHLRVLLTTRSKHLRSHPGQTALPGGKYDEVDGSLIWTAYREANEEVGLPKPESSSTHIYTIGTLRPFLSLHKLIVTPVVALLTDVSILSHLKPSQSEVSRIFHHPLEAILQPEFMAKEEAFLTNKDGERESLVDMGTDDWIYQDQYHNTSDVAWLQGTTYRMHRFRSTASPVKGLTADILIHAAEIGYARSTSYERWAPGQPESLAAILRILELDDAEHRERARQGEGKIITREAERDRAVQIYQ